MSFDHKPRFQASFLLPKYWPLWGIILLAGMIALVPSVIRAKLGDWLAGIFCRGNSKRKRIAQKNLSLCFPQLSAAQNTELLYQHYRISTHLFLSYGRLLFGSSDALRNQFDIQGLDIIEASAAEKQNVIFLAPHFMAMEYAGIYLSMNYDMSTMTRLHKNPVLDWLVSRMRAQGGGTIFSKDTNMLAVVRSIRSGKWFYYLPDEDYGSDNALFVPFFGIQKASVPALAKLAQAGRAVVIPLLSTYCPDRRRFSISFSPPLTHFPSGDLYRDAVRINDEIKKLIVQAPAQYYWTSKIFRTRPQGEASFY